MRENCLVGFVSCLAFRADPSHQALGEHSLQRGRDHERLHAHVDKAGDGSRRVVGVKGGEDKVTGQGGLDGDLGRLDVTRFSNHDPVGILTQEGPEYLGKGQPEGLVHRNLHDSVDLIFDGILRREQFGIDRVDLVKAGVEGRGLSRSSGPGDNEDAVRLLDDAQDVIIDVFGHLERFQIKFHGIAIQHAEHNALTELGG